MPSARIRFDAAHEVLTVASYGELLTEGMGDFTTPRATVEDLRLVEVAAALRRAVALGAHDDPHLAISDDRPEHFGEHSPIANTDLVLRQGELVTRVYAAVDEPPAPPRVLGSQLQPLLSRRRAQLLSVEHAEMPGYWTITTILRWRPPGARVGQALLLAPRSLRCWNARRRGS